MTAAETLLSTVLELALRSLAAIASQGGDVGNGLTLWASDSPWAERAFRVVGKERGIRFREHAGGDGIDLLDAETSQHFATLYLKETR